MKSKIKVLFGIVSLAVITMIGGTWASETKRLITGNEYQTAYYWTQLEENFVSPNDWKPGVETEKDVWVNNKGDVPVITKVVLNQEWIRRANVTAVTEPGGTAKPIPPLEGEKYELKFQPEDEYAAIINFNKAAVVVLGDGSAKETPEGIPYVSTIAEAKGKWLLATDEPDEDGNWVAYYIGIVEPKSETPHLIKSVTMNPKLRNTVIGSKTEYIKDGDGYKKVTYNEVNPYPGYDNATYTLAVTMTTVQATKDAVGDVFKTTHKEIVDYLIKDVAQTGVYVAEGKKVLTMKEKDGTLGYVPQGAGSKTEDGNWFMSFTDMIPGGIYKDEMQIENDTYHDFHLYMKAVPREQSEVKDELLELITMKVYHNGTLIYDGKASGAKDALEKNLQETVYLGYYSSQNDGKIEVELQLDPDMSLDDAKYLDANGRFKYADVLSKIDWQFWVVRKTSTRTPDPKPIVPTTAPPTPTEPPVRDVITDEYDPFGVLGEFDEMIPVGVLGATGDDTPILPVVAAMLVCAGFMAFVIARRKKESYEE